MSVLGRYKKRIVIVSSVLTTSLLLFHFVQAGTGEPGSDADPVVTKSYVDTSYNNALTKVDAVSATVQSLNQQVRNLPGKEYIDSRNSELSSDIDSLTAMITTLNEQVQLLKQQNSKFEIIEGIEPGKQLIMGDSTEAILRSGKAVAIASVNGGLSDLTSGTGIDIKTGESVPANHLLLSSRDDGRGMKITEKSWVLIKGAYTIK